MSHLAKCATVFLCVAVLTGTQNPPRARSFEFQYLTRIPAIAPGAGKLRLWIPVPPSNEGQKISRFAIESPIRYELHEDPEYHNRYAYLELDPRRQKTPVDVRLRIQATRYEHRAPARPPGKDSAELARSLQPDRRVPLDGIIATLAAGKTQGLERPLDKARAIYNYVVSTMRYDKSGEGWGRGDAVYACNTRKGNCTDFHALLIGMMRASGIPARFEIGFSLPPDRRAGEIPGYHCWAQFWLDGVGWVPVDASEAWKDPSRRDYFFGAHDEHRLLFSRGRDIRLHPAQQDEPLNYFVYPYAELDGKAFPGVEYRFWFRDLEIKDR